MEINLTSKKILIVEAHATLLETIKHILVSLGGRSIVTAESGSEAIAAMKKDRFDVVLCDYNLPDKKTGQQVLDDARYLKLLPVNAIFMIATDEHRLELALGAIENKPDDYLVKPFSLKQLSSLLERCYSRKEYLASIENEIDSGNLYQAIHHCEKLLQRNDKSMRLQLLKMQAELELKVGNFKKAGDVYQAILQQRELPWARLGFGIVVFCLGDYDQAINTFQGLVQQYPMMLEAYDWLVKAYESKGNDGLALSSLSSAVTLAPSAILRQKKLAVLADKVGNLPVAQKAYAATVELGKNSIHRSSADYSGLANIYLKRHAADKALEITQRMSQQFKNDPETKLRAALLEIGIHQEKGNERLAQRAYKNALELNALLNKQISRELRLEMAKTFCLNGDRKICDEILDDLIKTHIDDSFLKDIVMMCDTTISKNYAETWIQPIKKELADLNNKAANLFKEGDIKGARAVYEQAITQRPDNHKVILNMIKIIIHDIKASGADPEKIMSAQSYINKAIQIGIPHNQVSVLQTVLDTIKNKTNQ
jgi:CheY-like chemotaxis protein